MCGATSYSRLPLLVACFTAALLLGRSRAEPVTFRFDDPGAESVALAGEFNNWRPEEIRRDKHGLWTKALDLPPGTYGYKFLVNGRYWLLDPANPARKMVGGHDNSAVVVGDGVFRPPDGAALEEWTFTLVDEAAQKVSVAGTFNGWNTSVHPMSRSGGGPWVAEVPIPTGKTAYKFIVDGRWVTDPGNPETEPDGQGGSNSVVTVEEFHATNDEPQVSHLHMVYAFTRQMRTWLEDKRFADLEAMAAGLRSAQTRWQTGLWKLPDFYVGVTAQQGEYETVAPLLEEWIKAYPDSVTPRVAKAESLVNHAWAARGSDRAAEVKPEAWPVFEERLQQARAVIEEARGLPAQDPALDSVMQTVCLGLGKEFGRSHYEELFSRATAAFPEYYGYYFSKAHYLLPRWHGERGEWEAFAAEAADSSSEGDALYTRIAWANSRFYEDLFKETAVSWPRMKKGFEQILEAYPDSRWNLSSFARFAMQAGDVETARRLVGLIGGTPDIIAWRGPGRWREAQRLANGREVRAPIRAAWEMPGRVACIVPLPGGRSFAALDTEGTLALFDTDAEDPTLVSEFPSEQGAQLAVSPDGKWLAAAFHREEGPGRVRVFSLPSMKGRTILEDWKGEVMRLAFTPDSRELLIAGGTVNGEGDMRIWDTGSGRVSPFVDGELPSGYVAYADLSPDGKFLAVGDNRTLVLWDFPARKVLKRIPRDIGGWVMGLSFSPDGKQLAELTGSGWNNGGRDSRLFLWDTSTWESREVPLDNTGGGPIRVLFSPDGKVVATGGVDHDIRLWSANGGDETACLSSHKAGIQTLAFVEGGLRLLSGALDRQIIIWDLEDLPLSR
jgi:hypothetical protein